MAKFWGILGYMGLVPLPNIRYYWSNRYLYNRFETILKRCHFSNNEEISDSRVGKLKPLIDYLREKFSCICTPRGTMCIDETMIPFRGRLNIRHYLPNKTHKYGVKVV